MVLNEDAGAKPTPFSAGWRNKVTGTVYRNRSTQTGSNYGTRERIAQTEFSAEKCTDVQRHVALQVNSFPDVRDRILTANVPSRDSNLEHSSDQKILRSVIKIQRFYRAHRGGETATRPPGVSPCTKATDDGQIPAEPGPYPSGDFAILNRTSPRTRTDFELLYNLLDRWRVRETERAGRLLFEPSRIALCSVILSREAEILRAIDSMKTTVKLTRRESGYGKFLDELSRPARWRNSRGGSILVDTLRVQRARRFKDAFDELSREKPPVQERIETLSRLRGDVEPHTCKPSNDLIRLIDQEVDLLARNVDGSKLRWLRKRLKMIFLELARNVLRKDYEEAGLTGWLQTGSKRICKSCGRLLPLEKFPREERGRSSSCNYCLYVKVQTEPRVVYRPYERLLRDVRRREAKARCYTSLAFVIDSKLVYHLANDIWHGKSAISENDRLEELRLTRFRGKVHWSPWNCLLLTAKEASIHGRVNDLEKFYGEMLLQKFHTKNLQAKVLFEPVIGMDSDRGRKLISEEGVVSS